MIFVVLGYVDGCCRWDDTLDDCVLLLKGLHRLNIYEARLRWLIGLFDEFTAGLNLPLCPPFVVTNRCGVNDLL